MFASLFAFRRFPFIQVLAGLPFFCAFLVLSPVVAFAHSADYDFSSMSRTAIGLAYLKLGYQHILPLGLDHILFILCLFLLSPSLKSVIWQATAFTIAHSITLALAMYGLIHPPAAMVEAVIALSIVLVAVENILTDQLRPWRMLLVFFFGLIHGMGFAGVLMELGLPKEELLTAILTFNLGVEVGQVTVILLCYGLVGLWFGKKEWYHRRIVIPASVLIAAIALYWTVERTVASIHS
jgi:hypothetical protein